MPLLDPADGNAATPIGTAAAGQAVRFVDTSVGLLGRPQQWHGLPGIREKILGSDSGVIDTMQLTRSTDASATGFPTILCGATGVERQRSYVLRHVVNPVGPGLFFFTLPMFAAVPTWSLLLLAGMAILLRRWSSLRQLFSATSFRVDVVGDRQDVAPRVANGLFAEYHRQLIDLGFAPLGVFRESLPGARADKEYVLVNRGRKCRASIYALGGGPPRVCLKSDTADGRLIATFNYGDEELEQDTADYIDWRHPTHSMEELLEEHEDARYSWMNDGATLVAPRTIEEAAELETRNFFNDSVRRRFQCALIAFMLWGLPFVAVFSVGTAWLLPGDFWRLFNVCVIVFTGMGYALEKWCERGALQEITVEQSSARAPANEAAVA